MNKGRTWSCVFSERSTSRGWGAFNFRCHNTISARGIEKRAHFHCMGIYGYLFSPCQEITSSIGPQFQPKEMDTHKTVRTEIRCFLVGDIQVTYVRKNRVGRPSTVLDLVTSRVPTERTNQ